MESFTASELFNSFEGGEDFIILDVRNEEDFSRFSIEGPVDVLSLNIPYFDFIERPEESVAKVPSGPPVRVVCAKQGSSEFVRDVLMGLGRENVTYLHGGINTWGNVLIPKRVNSEDSSYELWQFNRPGKASCSYGLIYGAEMYVFDPSKTCRKHSFCTFSMNFSSGIFFLVIINVINRAKSLRFKEAKSFNLSKIRLFERVLRPENSQSTSKKRAEADFEIGFPIFRVSNLERGRF